nr:MAG: Pectate lyase superfamily protein [Bacteriophage sp.]
MSINPIHRAPYTNFHDLNLDWIMDELNEFNTKLTNFVSLAAIKYANPIQWDITRQYEANTVVVDSNGNAYLSVKPVPSGVSLDRTEFWTEIGNFDELWADVKKAITPNDEGHSTTATAARAVNDLVWVNGALVRVTRAMIAGDAYVPGSNCVSSSTNEVLHYLVTTFNEGLSAEKTARENADTQLQRAIDAEQTARENADTQLHTAIGAETMARESADTQLQTAIGAETTARENADSDLQDSINQLKQDVKNVLDYANVKSYGAKGDGTTDDTVAFSSAIASGSDLYIPDGEYIITGAIDIGSPLMTSGAIVVASGVTLTIKEPIAPCTLHFRRRNSGAFLIKAGETIADWFIDTGIADVFHGGSIQPFTGTIKFLTHGSWRAANNTITADTIYKIDAPVRVNNHTSYDFCNNVVSFGPNGCINIVGDSPTAHVERLSIRNATFVATAENVQQFFNVQYAQRITIDNLQCIGGRRIAQYTNTINIYTSNIIHDGYYKSSSPYSSYLLDESSGGASGISGNASIRFYNCISSLGNATGDSQQFNIYNSNDIRDVYIDSCECVSASTAIQIYPASTADPVWNIWINDYIADQCNRGVYVVNSPNSLVTVVRGYFNAKDTMIEFQNSSGVVSNCQFIGTQSCTGVKLSFAQGGVVDNCQFINVDQCIVLTQSRGCQISKNLIKRTAKYTEAVAISVLNGSTDNRIFFNTILPVESCFYTAGLSFDSSSSRNLMGANTVAGVELNNSESDLQKMATTSV